MALNKQVIPIQFKGLDTKTDNKWLVPGTFTSLENCVFTKVQRLSKRNGFDDLTNSILGTLFTGDTTLGSAVVTNISSTTGLFVGQALTGVGVPAYTTIQSLDSATQLTLSNVLNATNSNTAFSSFINVGTALATYFNELDLFSGSALYSYSAGNGQWTNKGNATSVNLSTNSVIKNSYQQTTPDMTYSPLGVKVFTWEDTRGGSRYSVIDAVTNEILVADKVLSATAVTPKPMALGSYLILLYRDTNDGHLKYTALSAANPGNPVASAIDVASNMNVTNPNYDAAILGNDLIIAYNNADAGNGISALYLTSNLILSAAVDTTAESASACINVATDPVLSQIWISYFNGTQVKGFVLGAPLQPSTTITVNFASPAIATVSSTAGFYVGMPFTFQQGTAGVAAGGTSFGTTYYVTATTFTSTTFTFSATLGGSNINTSSASSGTIYIVPTNPALASILSPHSIATIPSVRNIAAFANNGIGTFWYEADASLTVTVTSASPAVATVSSGTTLYNGEPFQFSTLSGTLAGNTALNNTYYVENLSASTFNFSKITFQAASVNTTSGTTGTVKFVPANSSNFINYNTMTNAGVTGTTPSGVGTLFLKSVGLASKVISYNNLQYFAVALQTPLQSTYYLVNNNAQIVAKYAPALGGGYTTKSILPELVNTGVASQYSIAFLLKDLLTTQPGATANTTQVYTQTGVEESAFNFTSKYNYLTSQLANNLHISGGFLSVYDGTSVVEHNFHYYPENVSAISSTSGGFIGNGTTPCQYQYQITYEWTDNQGQIQRSTAIPITLTYFNSNATALGSVVLTIPTVRLTSKQAAATPPRSPVSIVIYRTEANGTTFYRISSITSPTLNTITADAVTYTDTLSDGSIIGNPLLYTTGGVVDDSAAPAISAICTYQDRIIAVPSENPLQFWYSKQVVPGEPVEFSDSFVQNFDIRGGDATAVAPMDDKLVVFKETEIFYMVGNGPDPTGGNNTFSDLQLITTDCGSVGPIVAVTPTGLMFKGLKGIYLLDRGLNSVYIGAPVEAYNQYDIVSATLVTEYNQVRFCLTNKIVLVYDYFVNQWSIFTNINAVASTIFDNDFTYLQPTGTVMVETPNSYTDAGQFISMKLTTGWLSFNQITGYQRVYSLMLAGDYASPHKLQFQIAYDYNPNPLQTTYIDAGALLENDNYGVGSPYGNGNTSPGNPYSFGATAPQLYGGGYQYYEFKLQLQKQKCTAFQFTIQDVAETPYGEGFSLSSVGCLIGAKSGLGPRVSKQFTFG